MSMNLEDLRRYKPQIIRYVEQYGIENIPVFGLVVADNSVEHSDVDSCLP